MKTRQRMRTTICSLLLVLFTLAAPGALASAPAQVPDIADASLAPAAPSATLLVHFDAANIDGTGTQSGDICSRTGTTWVNLANPGTSDGTLGNFTLPCTTNEGWKGNGTSADPYRLHFNGSGIALPSVPDDYVAFTTTASAQSLNLWFYSDPGLGEKRGYLVFPLLGFEVQLRMESALLVNYNDGITVRTGMSNGAWHMVTIVNDGSRTRFYLDNVEFATEASSAATEFGAAVLGRRPYSNGYYGFNGGVASFRLYGDALTRSEISNLYQQERYRFQPSTGALRIERIQNAYGGLAGGDTVTIYGQHFGEPITGVTFGGVPASGITVLDEGRLTVQTPAHSAGYVDVTVASAISGSDTAPGAFRYTNLPTDNLLIWYDAANTDARGSKGWGITTNPWANLTYGPDGGLAFFDQPASADEGWKGDGSMADPYRLQFDG
ncbi:MAG TPA: LamG-like jellyroll fold domain-containing protein, partial [Anaerolineae bacterium]|nr:LamG-like jellyroll fold domain-containing protein [Anaerolineae bacterium]